MEFKFNNPQAQQEWKIAEQNRSVSQLERYLDKIRRMNGALLMEAYQAQRDFIDSRISSDVLLSIGDAYDYAEVDEIFRLTHASRVSPDRKEMLIQEYLQEHETFHMRNLRLIEDCANLTIMDIMAKWRQTSYEYITIVMRSHQVNYDQAEKLIRAWKKEKAAQRKAAKEERKALRAAIKASRA